MYPASFFALFPPFPHEEKVFVAMSFDRRFDARWERVIKPGIEETGLEAHRVDTRIVSDSILTEILDGIGRDRLILADVSALDEHRNGNVMYEVGIAHAARQPEEVLLFRSDTGKLLFDLANVRVNSYDPDGNAAAAKATVTEAVKDALREVDLKKSLAVRRAADSLDFRSWWLLMCASKEPFSSPPSRNVVQALGSIATLMAITRLLDLGLLASDYPRVSAPATLATDSGAEQLIKYGSTPLGDAVLQATTSRFGIDQWTEADVQSLFDGREP